MHCLSYWCHIFHNRKNGNPGNVSPPKNRFFSPPKIVPIRMVEVPCQILPWRIDRSNPNARAPYGNVRHQRCGSFPLKTGKCFAPENGWLEDKHAFPIGGFCLFSGAMAVFREGRTGSKKQKQQFGGWVGVILFFFGGRGGRPYEMFNLGRLQVKV